MTNSQSIPGTQYAVILLVIYLGFGLQAANRSPKAQNVKSGYFDLAHQTEETKTVEIPGKTAFNIISPFHV